jgi:hypothetical protein
VSKIQLALPLALLALPLGAQAWDVRVEVPFASGQNLPQTFLTGTNELASGKLNTGSGSIITGSGRIFRVGPILKFEWNAELVQWRASGQIQQGTTSQGSSLTQKGFGFGLNAQLWVPFTGLAAEVGVLERFNAYTYQGAGESQSDNLIQPWMRVGVRWELPIPVLSPYLCASYQQPITSKSPMVLSSTSDLKAYLSAQGSGQQFDRVWTFGVGLMF